MSSSLSPADSGTTSKAEPGLAKGVQFDYNQLLRHHESESADIPISLNLNLELRVLRVLILMQAK